MRYLLDSVILIDHFNGIADATAFLELLRPDTRTLRPTDVCAISYAGGVGAAAPPTNEGVMHG